MSIDTKTCSFRGSGDENAHRLSAQTLPTERRARLSAAVERVGHTAYCIDASVDDCPTSAELLPTTRAGAASVATADPSIRTGEAARRPIETEFGRLVASKGQIYGKTDNRTTLQHRESVVRTMADMDVADEGNRPTMKTNRRDKVRLELLFRKWLFGLLKLLTIGPTVNFKQLLSINVHLPIVITVCRK